MIWLGLGLGLGSGLRSGLGLGLGLGLGYLGAAAHLVEHGEAQEVRRGGRVVAACWQEALPPHVRRQRPLRVSQHAVRPRRAGARRELQPAWLGLGLGLGLGQPGLGVGLG